jgi:glutathione S-transferase
MVEEVAMKLNWAPTSPYARKALVAAHECGLAERLELVATTPATVEADLAAANPLGRIPTLIADEGETLYDSLVICEYFDHLAGRGLSPPPGPKRWAVLRRHALGQGLIDAAVGTLNERRRPEGERSESWLAARTREIARALDALEAEAARLGEGPDLATIAIAVALAYLDFRFADEGWRAERPALTAWHAEQNRRPAMLATEFPAR